MPISLDSYREYIKKRNFVQNPSYYRLQVYSPDGKDLICYPDSIILPGRNFINTPFSYYGPEFSMPLRREYGEMSANFIVHQDWKERAYFEQWMDTILPYTRLNASVPFGNANDLSDVIDNLPGKMKTVEIVFLRRQLAENDSRSNCKVVLNDAYPSIITPTQFSSDNSGYTIFTVNFAFKDYTMEINGDNPANVDPPKAENF
jgi:hypothetical protein